MNLIESSYTILTDAKTYLTQICPNEYTQKIDLMSNSTIGQHTRHFIEFFLCLIHQQKSNTINYCKRKRDLLIETNPQEALTAINYILKKIDKLDFEKKLTLFTEDKGTSFIESNIAREVLYNIEHTIHHLAMIKIALKLITPNIFISPRFGIAESTIKHQKAALLS